VGISSEIICLVNECFVDDFDNDQIDRGVSEC